MFKKAGDTDTRVAILKKRVLTSQIIGGGKIMMKGFRKGRQRFSHKGRINKERSGKRKGRQVSSGVGKRIKKRIGRGLAAQIRLSVC
jgi:hypothetical protein